MPWKSNLKTFSEIYEEASKNAGDKFLQDFDKTVEQLKKDIAQGKINIPESTFVLIEKGRPL
ncbi:MAG: hypothetical protein JJT76_04155 [Clostridiaceae bacterium]|nr:hypothetical protein [Clostridiaceae bacterium]